MLAGLPAEKPFLTRSCPDRPHDPHPRWSSPTTPSEVWWKWIHSWRAPDRKSTELARYRVSELLPAAHAHACFFGPQS